MATDISGVYNIKGVNPNGSKYQGTLAIKKNFGVYFFSWSIAKQKFSGKGKLRGNKITVDWGAKDPVIYTVQSDGTLRGVWARGKATENAYPKSTEADAIPDRPVAPTEP